MSKTNLFRMDEVLLKGGAYFGIAIYTVAWLLHGEGRGIDTFSGGLKLLSLGLMMAPLVLFFSGLRLRRRENRALALRKLIDDEVEISALELVANSDWTNETLDRAIRDLNNAGVAHLVWDRRSGWIQDGRLRRSAVSIDRCGACSAKISVEVAIGSLSGFSCPFCGEGLGSAQLAEEKARIVDELEADRNASPERSGIFASKDFSPVTFCLLLALFWPGAVYYALRSGSHRRFFSLE